MKIIPRLRWYEWIGWAVNALMIAASVVFIAVSAMEGESRASLIGLCAALFLVGVWSWVLLFYGKERGEETPDGGRESGCL